jgi:hypothetical protein
MRCCVIAGGKDIPTTLIVQKSAWGSGFGSGKRRKTYEIRGVIRN